jgi:hypothetical protein
MSVLAIASNEVPFYLRSAVAGRDRWELPVLFNDRRRAAAIQTILRTEPGIRKVVANHLTGRVLIEYLPGELNEPVETLLRRAVAFGPMLAIEFAEPTESKRKGRAVWSSLGALASAELGCLLFKLMFFSIGCPTLGTAAAVVFTVAAVSKSCRGLSCADEPGGGVVLDEPGRVSDYQNRA